MSTSTPHSDDCRTVTKKLLTGTDADCDCEATIPIRRYGGAVWARRVLRKPTWHCLLCRNWIPKGEEAWYPIVENGRRGLHRAVRMCWDCMGQHGEVPSRGVANLVAAPRGGHR